MTDRVATILSAITDWVRSQKDIRGLALVGSHARSAASPASDVDLVLLTDDPQTFRDPAWLSAIAWHASKARPENWTDEEYGAVWSRRVWLYPEGEVELSFARLSWADTTPVDPGTARVVAGGCRILHDPNGLLERLVMTVTRLVPNLPAEGA